MRKLSTFVCMALLTLCGAAVLWIGVVRARAPPAQA